MCELSSAQVVLNVKPTFRSTSPVHSQLSLSLPPHHCDSTDSLEAFVQLPESQPSIINSPCPPRQNQFRTNLLTGIRYCRTHLAVNHCRCIWTHSILCSQSSGAVFAIAMLLAVVSGRNGNGPYHMSTTCRCKGSVHRKAWTLDCLSALLTWCTRALHSRSHNDSHWEIQTVYRVLCLRPVANAHVTRTRNWASSQATTHEAEKRETVKNEALRRMAP